MKRIVTIACLSLFVAAASRGYAESLIIDADAQFQFAEKIFKTGDYPLAITEYNRFIHFFPDDDRIDTALFQSAMAYRLNNQFEEAIEGFDAVIQISPKNSPRAIRSHFLVSDCYMKQNDPGSARQILMDLLNHHQNPEIQDAVWYRMAWIDIETGHFKAAMDRIEHIGPGASWMPVQDLSADLADAAVLPEKNPALAGMLSVIPGAGYAYCGRYQDGLTAFLLNGALIWAAVASFSNDNPALGCVISVVESGFYMGNIYGGINAAHKYNARQKQGAINRLKSGYQIGLSPSGDTTGWQINLQHDF